ncbi:MAG: cell division protein FtsQ/DivIB [Candidatus Cryptobacteroides sp.]
MNRLWKYALVTVFLIAVLMFLTFLDRREVNEYHGRTCSGTRVEFEAGADKSFITEADVEGYIAKGYGSCSGKRLEDIDLQKIEEVLNARGPILRADAYVTKDGYLNVTISQRRPVVRLISGSGSWYADASGFIFPTQRNYTSRVPVVDGRIPLKLTAGFKGMPESEAEKAWMDGVLELVDFLADNRGWADSISQIHVDSRGRLVLVPGKGREKFIIGRPEEFREKFGLIEDYYRYVRSRKDDGYYSTVDVSYSGQIVCRK